jgi:glucose/arabinose dehydrogenase
VTTIVLPKRGFFTTLIIVTILLLGACDNQPAQPTPTTTTPPSPIAQETPASGDALPTNTTPPAEQPTADVAETPTAPAQPTATTAQAADEPLTLSPVAIETNDTTRTGAFSQERSLNLPPGFGVKVFATGLEGVRWLGLSPEGVVYATVRGEGQVVTLPDADKDGVADEAKTFADGLPGVHGIVFKDGAVYVATEGEIIRLEDTDKDGAADKRDVLASDLPTDGGHSTRTIAFGTDGKLYVSVGSSCNVCVEENEKRAAILRYSADGKFEKVYAKGLRNAVGILFHPVTGELWATNNGRDQIGDDIPPETVYNVKEDTDYGWPFCYGDRVPDTTQDVPAGYCEKTGVPAVKMQAHSAPLGLAFYTGDQFPAQFKGDLFVAFHGSWNRIVPTGYKVVRIRMKDNQPDASAGDLLVEDFITGWHLGTEPFGRPVDPMMAPDGSLLLTDDEAGAIYSIYYQENVGP